jgi:hypothetical protein
MLIFPQKMLCRQGLAKFLWSKACRGSVNFPAKLGNWGGSAGPEDGMNNTVGDWPTSIYWFAALRKTISWRVAAVL